MIEVTMLMACGCRQRIVHQRYRFLLAGEIQIGQHHGGDGRHREGLEQVRRHAGAVADIVAHIVGDGGGIARIIFGNARFHLTNHVVAADIGALGEDAAAQTGEDRNQRSAETSETDQGRSSTIVRRLPPTSLASERPRPTVRSAHNSPPPPREDAEPDHQHAGDGAGAELLTTERPWARPRREASVVRTLARTETYMPT